MSTFNVAFLGVGRMGIPHLRNLVGVDVVHVRVVTDVNKEAAQRGGLRCDRTA